jgi:hypothetical protein
MLQIRTVEQQDFYTHLFVRGQSIYVLRGCRDVSACFKMVCSLERTGMGL